MVHIMYIVTHGKLPFKMISECIFVVKYHACGSFILPLNDLLHIALRSILITQYYSFYLIFWLLDLFTVLNSIDDRNVLSNTAYVIYSLGKTSL